jgi:hypothetical protein
MRILPTHLITVAKLTAVSVVLATTLGQAAEFARHPETGRGGPETSTVARSSAARFKIRGHIAHLYPGKKTEMRLGVTNPNGFPIVVRSIKVKVRPAGRWCTAKALKVSRFHGARRIRAHHTVKMKLRIRMRRKVSRACMGARFPLRFVGKATRP